jgi:shikimate kinase
MRLKGTGRGTAFGAATIVNAMPSGRGAAFSVGLRTLAEVTLKDDPAVDVEIEGGTGVAEETGLAVQSFRGTLGRFGLSLGASIRTRSEIPIARGMKSSSAASNAVVLATLDAIGESMDAIEIIRVGVEASLRSGVSLTGAMDDACASCLGGLHVTDNRRGVILKSLELEAMSAIFLIPEERRYSGKVDRGFISQYAPISEVAIEEALCGRHWHAMLLNGFAMAHAFRIDPAPVVAAMRNGAVSAGVCGKGPSICAVSRREQEGQIAECWEGLGCRIIRTAVNNVRAVGGV